MKTIEEKKLIIAKFMDAKFSNYADGSKGVILNPNPDGYLPMMGIDGLKYDTSWDWLMPVVKKCRTRLFSPRNATEVYMLRDLEDAVLTLEIEEAFEEVINVIEWYNEKL